MSEPYWVPLGSVPVDYKGAYAAGTAYAAGDVVRYQGVDYLAVNPSQGSTPPTLAPLPGMPVPLIGAYRNGTPIIDGGWHTLPDDALYHAAAGIPFDLIGSGKLYNQYRLLAFVYMSAVGSCTGWNINIGIDRPGVGNLVSTGANSLTLTPGFQHIDGGWQNFPVISAGSAVLTRPQYLFNIAGGSPTVPALGVACWIRSSA